MAAAAGVVGRKGGEGPTDGGGEDLEAVAAVLAAA
jgi:hypothetical protein